MSCKKEFKCRFDKRTARLALGEITKHPQEAFQRQGDNRNSELVSLDSELIFIRSYTYLLQIRFDTNIVFEFEVEDAKRQLLLPPMALQVLIENAIKHNEVSSEQPLTIVVSARENYLEVKNNLQLRVNKETSCKTGLQNIKDRYGFFTTHPVEVIQNQNSFIVKIPLLHTS